jgi:hypothetical protein
MIRISGVYPELPADVQAELIADRLRRRPERLDRRADALRERVGEAFKIERELRRRGVAVDLCARLECRESRRFERMATLRLLAAALKASAEDLRNHRGTGLRRPQAV